MMLRTHLEQFVPTMNQCMLSYYTGRDYARDYVRSTRKVPKSAKAAIPYYDTDDCKSHAHSNNEDAPSITSPSYYSKPTPLLSHPPEPSLVRLPSP